MNNYADNVGRIVKKHVKKDIKPLECTLYLEMKPLWKLFRIWGLLPYTEIHETGDIAFYWLSRSILYSVVVIAIVCTSVGLIITHRLDLIKTLEQPSFDFQLFNILNMLVPTPILFIPVTFWVNTKNFVEYIRTFAEFETDYYRILRNKLDVKIRKCCTFVLAIILTYNITVNVAFTIVEKRLAWYRHYPYLHMLTILYLQLPYCGFLTHILIRASENIQKKISKDALTRYDAASHIREYRLLWLKLRNLSRNTFSIFVRVVFVIAILTTSSMTISTYMCCISIFLNEGHTIRAVVFSMTSMAITSMLFFVAYRTELLCDAIGKNFISNFFKNRRNLNCYKEDAISEMKIFIEMLKGVDTKITNSGYFSLDKSASISLISLMTTYILIIVQFRINQPKSALHFNDTDWNELS